MEHGNLLIVQKELPRNNCVMDRNQDDSLIKFNNTTTTTDIVQHHLPPPSSSSLIKQQHRKGVVVMPCRPLRDAFQFNPIRNHPFRIALILPLFSLSIHGTHAGVLRLINYPSKSHLPFKSTHDKVRVVPIRIPTLLSNSSANHSKSSHQHNHPQINGYLIHVCKNHFRFDEVAIFHDGTFKEMRKRATNDTSLYSLTHQPNTGEPHNLLLYLLDGF